MNRPIINIIRAVLIVIILIITTTIFGFSSQNAEQSSSVSGKVAEYIIDKQPKYKNISKIEKKKLVEKYQHPIRKMAHFTIYTVLGMAIVGLTCTYKISNKKRIIITLIAGALYAASDEIHQTFIEGRSGQITDVLLDTAGVILGAIVIVGLVKIITKKVNI